MVSKKAENRLDRKVKKYQKRQSSISITPTSLQITSDIDDKIVFSLKDLQKNYDLKASHCDRDIKKKSINKIIYNLSTNLDWAKSKGP